MAEHACTLSARLQARKATVLPSVSLLPPEQLLGVFPTDAIERVIGQPLEWNVFRNQDEVLENDPIGYNILAFNDVRARVLGSKAEERRMGNLWNSHSEDRDFANRIGYQHNQAMVQGTLNGALIASVHLGGKFESDLFLEDLGLVNPNGSYGGRIPFKDQRGPGIGNGIFDEVLNRLELLARQLGYRAISGHAADWPRARLFERHRFALDLRDPELSRLSKLTEVQVPIWRSLGEEASSG